MNFHILLGFVFLPYSGIFYVKIIVSIARVQGVNIYQLPQTQKIVILKKAHVIGLQTTLTGSGKGDRSDQLGFCIHPILVGNHQTLSKAPWGQNKTRMGALTVEF